MVMASHMSSIGFAVQSIDEMKSLGKHGDVQAKRTVQVPISIT